MILIEAGTSDDKAFDAKLLFAMQLASNGHEVAIDAASLPESLERHQKYEVSRFLVDLDRVEITRVLVIGAENIEASALKALRRDILPETQVCAIGRFPDHQSVLGAQAKIAYMTGREPQIVNLSTLQPNALISNGIAPLCVGPARPHSPSDELPQVIVYLPLEWLDDPLTLPALGALSYQAEFDLSVIISGLGKDRIAKSDYSGLKVYGYSNISPETFASICDIAVFFGDSIPGERMAGFALETLRASGIVVDSTTNSAFAATGAPVLRGPHILSALAPYLTGSVLNNYQSISQAVGESSWMAANALCVVEDAIGIKAQAPQPGSTTGQKTVFMPTNGNGLGHAQRCLLIAEAMEQADPVQFAAFPSCTPLIQNRGFDCQTLVQKSDNFPEPFANDLVNHLRLSDQLGTGDHLVFDGGYVFDSVYRCILEKRLRATWIRRGLWRPGQINATALEREKIFSQVIVPNEAFDELNTNYTFGPKLHNVGPIVRRDKVDDAQRSLLRDKLKARFDRDFDQLVITMLGGGVAADRSAQIQTICAGLDRRANCLNLILVWPNATIAPAIYGWKGTRVITSQNALKLAQLADLTISAVGYNSFHEIMYHAVPAIFVPQMAPFMDDQERRALAAAERGFASIVQPQELLLLDREIAAFLDGEKATQIRTALATADLPEPGNRAAARLIETVSGL